MERRTRAKPEPPKIQSILDLPGYIVMEILARLPPSSLLTCRYVCTSWRYIISDPDFSRLHHLPTLILRTGSTSILYSLFSVERSLTLGDPNSDIDLPESAISEFSPQFGLPNYELEVLSSCNGLICFYKPGTYYPYYIYDMFRDDHVVVPQIHSDLLDHAGSGFGFSPGTGHYKVLRFLNSRLVKEFRFQPEVEIMTVGTSLWRRVGIAPSYLHWISSGCFLAGGLHWMVHDSDNRFKSMYVFDFGEEKFQQFPSPSPLINESVNEMKLGLFGGCIGIIHHSSKHQFDIWVMKDYGNKESWTREFVVKTPSESKFYQPIMLSSNGELLILHTMTAILSYNASQRRFRSIRFSGCARYSKAIAYALGFASIKDALRGETVEMCRS